MVVSCSPATMAAMAGKLSFGAAALPLQEDVKILGVEVDRGLGFDSHVKTIAKKASHRISALRRVASFLDRRRLDSIQCHALRLVDAAPSPHPEPERPLDSLEHRRDVAAIVVFHKAQVQKVPHLAGLRHPRTVISDQGSMLPRVLGWQFTSQSARWHDRMRKLLLL
ncbi:hypothetical protein E2C01_014498 [Portunus trituberculatus]|uniref:Uncharacterized protein n=1 Tax=Portunus trituberculatus TaxID=210409 RepID=A0A5B7DJD6_PORTR|nr:hypothetical protein [Portunus trituberculatus]